MITSRGWLCVFLLSLALIMIAVNVRAAELPCPSKRHSCGMVKAAIATVGEDFVLVKVRACGWTEQEIEETKRRCKLRK